MGGQISKIIMAMLVVIALYNLVSSPNSQAIIGQSSSGSVGIIHALEGK